MPRSLSGLLRPLIAVCVLALAGGITGCTSSTYMLHEGECFNATAQMLTGKEDTTAIRPRSCTSSHNSEVIGVHTLEEKKYPGAASLVEKATQQCAHDFASYVGIDYRESAYDIYPLIPSEETWATDRTLTCIALSLPPIKASLHHAGKKATQRPH